MNRVQDLTYIVNEHVSHQRDILVDFKKEFRASDAEKVSWKSRRAEKIFRTLVIHVAEYLDEPNRLAKRLTELTPNEHEDEEAQVEDARAEQIVRYLLNDDD